MSVRAELIRAGLHLFLKRKGDDEPDLVKIRRGVDRTTWWVRNPPRTTRSAKIDASGRPADRGRDASYLAPPAQIRASGIPARGSHLGYLTAKRTSGQG